MVAYETLIPVDSTGDVLAYRLSFVNADPTVSGLLPEADRVGEMLGTAVRTGPDGDVNPADGLPDENAKPLLCVGPMEGAARRVGLMPPCTPTPRP